MPIIRLARPEDLESIQNIFLAATNAHRRPEDWSRLANAGGLVVAEANEQIVGFGGIDLEAVEQVKWLYVTPSYQGSGVGSLILKRMEEIGWSAGFTVIRLHAAPAAEQFYRRNGYEAVGPDEAIGHDHDGVELMKRRR